MDFEEINPFFKKGVVGMRFLKKLKVLVMRVRPVTYIMCGYGEHAFGAPECVDNSQKV